MLCLCFDLIYRFYVLVVGWFAGFMFGLVMLLYLLFLVVINDCLFVIVYTFGGLLANLCWFMDLLLLRGWLWF